MQRLPQDRFEQAPFNSSGVNLHTRPSGSGHDVVMFIHGLNGSGYGTWKSFPKYIFESGAPNIDVAVYEYATVLRRLRWPLKTASLRFYVEQVVAALRTLENDYDRIHLVGHSLGGALSEQVAMRYLESHGLQGRDVLSPLASITLMAAPRAGSGWAMPALTWAIREFYLIKRFSGPGSDVERYMTTHTESEITGPVSRRKVFLPRFACVGGNDKFVSAFSAQHAVSELQRLPLTETHSSLVKPKRSNDEQVSWLQKNVQDVAEARRQLERERVYSFKRASSTIQPVSPAIVTEFWGDMSGRWEDTYNQVRREQSTGDVLVQDHRLAPPDTRVDLLIAVADALAVVQGRPAEQSKVKRAEKRASEDSKLTVGVAAIGDECSRALSQIGEWLDDEPPPSMYLDQALDESALRELLTLWVQRIISRDPRRVFDSGAGRSVLGETTTYTFGSDGEFL